MTALLLIWEFFKTGLFAIGGGLTTLPFLSNMSQKYGWFTQEDIGNMLAVSESTPGPIGVNMATYVGNTVGSADGFLSSLFFGIITTLSLIIPSYVIILFVQKLMSRFSENLYVQGAMRTLRPASVGMVGAAVIGILNTVLFNLGAVQTSAWESVLRIPDLLIFAAIFVFYRIFNKSHPILVLLIGAILGIIFKL